MTRTEIYEFVMVKSKILGATGMPAPEFLYLGTNELTVLLNSVDDDMPLRFVFGDNENGARIETLGLVVIPINRKTHINVA